MKKLQEIIAFESRISWIGRKVLYGIFVRSTDKNLSHLSNLSHSLSLEDLIVLTIVIFQYAFGVNEDFQVLL